MAVFNDPVLYYTCDSADTSGSTITDKGSGGNTGTLVNVPTSTTGKIKQGILFNGSTQYIDAGNGASVQITGNLTLALWVKTTTSGGYQLIAKDSDTGGRAYTLDLSGTTARFYINGGGGTANEVDVTSAVPNATWTHIVATYSTTGTVGTLTVYINGSLAGASVGAALGAIPTATTNLNIGRRAYTGFNGYLNGEVDDVRLFNRALSAADAAGLCAYTGASKLLEARRKAAA